MVSPTFLASSLQNTAWTLELYPRGKGNSDYLSLKLCRVDSQGPENLTVNIEFSCVTADASILNDCFIPETFTNFGYGGYYEFLEPYFIQRHEVFGRRKALYLPRDILTLRCRMWKDIGDANEFGQSFGRTQLVIERIVSVENIDIENSVEKTFRIQSKRKNKALMSISVLCCDDMIDVRINPIGEEKMKFSTCKLSLVDNGRQICERKICFFGRPTENVWRLPFTDKVLPAENDDSDKSNCKFTTVLVYSTGEENKIIEKDCPLKISEFLTNYIGCAPSGDLTDCPNISEDLWELAKGRVLCDVELKTQNRSFFVHGTVLCARSPVFLAMLTGAMKEKEYG
ncbi:hypothetical protein AVEN_33142-1 [Araneus ventricosus]|uniref:BTB domain-containing protein n=1 Tax=Araneus ventricosus TaxID=182803 RepID=A0A4Y2TK39_ARAVE|nr:hypothetical protein AVEN_129254-1 [Araneus ventricosus]GBN99759.1 hypothetical protein AVEN_33142-1 [Araneus ventricosus]